MSIVHPADCVGYAYPAGAEPADRELTALPSTTMPFGNSDPFGNSTLVESGYSAIRRQLKGGGGAGAAFVGERKLVNPKFGSFDDFSSAMLLLFQMSTGDDWDTVMFWAMDSVGLGEPRKRNDSSGACLYFVSWMFVGCFAMQLFVGVVVDQFNTIRSEKDGSAHDRIAEAMGGDDEVDARQYHQDEAAVQQWRRVRLDTL